MLKEYKARGNDSLKDLTLLCGDFNLHRDEMNEETIKWLFATHKDWVNHLAYLDKEYHRVLDMLKLEGVFHVVNIWDQQRPGEKCVTYGDVKLDANGNKVPAETLLTENCLRMCEMCLDYIF